MRGAIRQRTEIGIGAATFGVRADGSGESYSENDHQKADDGEAPSKDIHGSVRCLEAGSN
ncbi:hypothetical protein D9M70_594910 [compost metagenome]